ncbi:hypothetical protein [Chryseobacterium oncorhynchi]|uniref:Uncharacterized protein n=1 Tax=Chryseobacterium oncorhynchi TaxID=741074 RepID=A0A316WCL4_9FLAO|nr:hypothetical protein [Chryseobacterium oncorhynchi]PWN59161.1 hypothetical protein C1638_021940 [Chryseobacterium oncorhynchi]
MKTFKIPTVSFGEIELTEEDLKLAKPIIDLAFSSLDDSHYDTVKKMKVSDVLETLAKMTDGELYHFAKINEEFMTSAGYKIDSFTLRIWKEIFKRNGIGYKQVGYISNKQRNLLIRLGLKYRVDRVK